MTSKQTRKVNFSQPQNQVAYSTELSKNSKFLYWMLTTYSNPCYPSYETLMGLMEVGRTTLSKSIKELTKFNIIIYKRGNSYGNANEYTILPVTEWKLNNQSHMGLTPVPDRHPNNTKKYKKEEWSASTGLPPRETQATLAATPSLKEELVNTKEEILIDQSHTGLPPSAPVGLMTCDWFDLLCLMEASNRKDPSGEHFLIELEKYDYSGFQTKIAQELPKEFPKANINYLRDKLGVY